MKIIRNNAEANDVRKRTRPEVPLSKEDFVAKRELIQRAYTRSIHENEQKQIRADNLRRLNERQAARASIASQDTEKSVQAPAEARPEEHRPEEHSTEPKSPPLHINTSFQRPDAVQQNVPVDEDSPTLGMPGTFVDDDEPPASAISNATEIENEPQTEAARLSRMPSRPSGLSSHMEYLDDQLSPEQAFFGMQNLGVEDDNIQIMLDATPVEEVQVESTPTKDAFARDPSPPGAFQEDQPVFTSTVTVASPQEATPAQSRPDSLFESGDEHFSSNDEHHSAEDVTITEFHTQPPEISYPERSGGR